MKKVKRYSRAITSKGHITIPAAIRQLLGIKSHDKVVFQIIEGKVKFRSVTMTLEDTFGAGSPRSRPEDFSALRDIAIEEHAQKAIDEMKDQGSGNQRSRESGSKQADTPVPDFPIPDSLTPDSLTPDSLTPDPRRPLCSVKKPSNSSPKIC
jgi:AbrB family looped-hinge helix DNA binding protein